MKKRVGIAKSLFYYYHYPLWKTFFEDIGAEVILSPESNQNIIQEGIKLAVDETCYPIKVFFGHIDYLSNQEQKLDYIFMPRVVSIERKSYICPKFMGLPDMIRAANIKNLPEMIEVIIDLSINENNLNKEIEKVGKIFSASSKQIKHAYAHALEELRKCNNIARDGYTLAESIEVWEGKKIVLSKKEAISVAVIGHGYSLYDRVISIDLIKKLRALGTNVHLAEMLDKSCIEECAATLPKRVFWTLGKKMVGTALHMEDDDNIDGVIYLACFGCGPDSMIGEIIERKINKKAFMMLTVDEHSGEAGLITRLEAFIDMLSRKRRQKLESNFSTYG